jgi:hypothetical protein
MTFLFVSFLKPRTPLGTGARGSAVKADLSALALALARSLANSLLTLALALALSYFYLSSLPQEARLLRNFADTDFLHTHTSTHTRTHAHT